MGSALYNPPDKVTNHRKPLMLVAMPSSGSDWLANSIVQINPALTTPCSLYGSNGGSYDARKEFFNPLCNPEHEAVLRSFCGCETTDTFDRIAKPASSERAQDFARIVNELWEPNGWDFTKEVWLGFQEQIVGEHFYCVALVRSERNTFPPSRLRVFQWYAAIHDSLVINGKLPESSRAATIRQKALIGHRYLYGEMCSSFERVIRWEDLVSDSPTRVAANCAHFAGYCDTEKLANLLIGTAQRRDYPAFGR